MQPVDLRQSSTRQSFWRTEALAGRSAHVLNLAQSTISAGQLAGHDWRLVVHQITSSRYCTCPPVKNCCRGAGRGPTYEPISPISPISPTCGQSSEDPIDIRPWRAGCRITNRVGTPAQESFRPPASEAAGGRAGAPAYSPPDIQSHPPFSKKTLCNLSSTYRTYFGCVSAEGEAGKH
jgi:hypothetical protein